MCPSFVNSHYVHKSICPNHTGSIQQLLANGFVANHRGIQLVWLGQIELVNTKEFSNIFSRYTRLEYTRLEDA